jgi:hypothetical protein
MATAAATSTDGRDAGFLAAWDAGNDEPDGAARIDARAIDPGGAGAVVSLAVAPPGVSLLFDDVAVSQAIRSVLSMPPADALSTLSQGDTRFVGAVTVVHGDDLGRLGHDPFAAVFPARLLRVEPGLFGRMPAPAGPVTQRYGAGNPWPWDRFAS